MKRFHCRRTLLFGLITLLWPTVIVAQTREAQTAASIRPVEMVSTQVRQIISSIDGQEYKLLIGLPEGYGDSGKSFPAVYVLDGQWDFTLVESLVGGQYEDGLVPPMLVVGITWGGKNPDYNVLRQRDFTPTKGRIAQTGNAPTFLRFVKQELIPFVDSNYRTAKDDRTLMGTSSGGLFALYTLFHEPALFNRYVMTSPNLSYDYQSLVSDEKAFAAKNKGLTASLFMCLGELEGGKLPMFQDYVDLVKSSRFEGLDLHTMVLPGTGHHSSVAEGYVKGLRAVFAPRALSISPAILDKYTGTYQINPRFTVQVVKEGQRLFFITPENSKLPMDPLSESDFRVQGVRTLLHFKLDAGGKVNGMESESDSHRQFNQKVH